jgi:Tfp pilus assembly protein PilF/TolB-like protein
MTRYVLIGVLGLFAALVGLAENSFSNPSSARFASRGAAAVASQAVGTPPAAAPAHAETLLVFPFENSSPQGKLDWLSEGFAELTIERLARAGETVFPRDERLAALERMGLPASTRFSRATMLKIAEELDADYVVFGQYSSDGKNIGITARVLRVSPPSLAPPAEESGTLDDLMDMHARLAWRLLGSVEPASAMSQQEFTRKLPRLRLDAFEHHVRGLLSPDDEQRFREFLEAARLEPGWDDPAFALGQSYFARRDCQAALPWLSRVRPAHERGQEAGFYAGVCYLLRNDSTRAETAFAGLLERARKSRAGAVEFPEALNNLGVAWMRLGKSTQAAVEFERATQLEAEEPDYWFNLGVARLGSNEPVAAVRPFREALRRQPADAQARALLTAALERSGRSSEAATEGEEPASRASSPSGREGRRTGEQPDALASLKPPALARLGRIKQHFDPAGLRPLPEPTVRAVAESSPSPPTAPSRRSQHRQLHLSRGREALEAGKLEDARHEFTQALVLGPNDPAVHQGLAEVYRRENRLDDAVREMRAALAVHDDAASHTALARLYVQQNLPVRAREELRSALKMDPGFTEARQLLDRLEGRAGPGKPK